jgi:hypothetical protein
MHLRKARTANPAVLFPRVDRDDAKRRDVI